MIPQRIQRKRTKGWRKPEGAIYVGRGSNWGNPFTIGSTNWIPVDSSGLWSKEPHPPLTRERVAECFRFTAEFTAREFPGHFAPLAGKNLMCWCPLTEPCHADVLLVLANGDRMPVGTPVLFWPGARVGEGRTSVTRTPIFKMGDGTEVVSVEGYPGGIALTHVQTLPVGETATGLDHTPCTTKEEAA